MAKLQQCSGSGGGGSGGAANHPTVARQKQPPPPPPPPPQQQHKPQQQRCSATVAKNPNFIDDSELFLTKLREFKPQSLGCSEARRKSSSTLIFPNPQQACLGASKCANYPHGVKPTPGYWIECHGPGVLSQAEAAAAASAAALAKQQQQYSSSSVAAAAGDPPQRPASGSSRSASADEQARAAKQALESLQRRGRTEQQTRSLLAGGATHDSFQRGVGSPEGGVGSSRAASSGGADTPVTAALSPLLRLSSVGQRSLEKLNECGGASGSGAGVGGNANRLRLARLSRRNVTRDDIDVRRETPNITITEPSFSQSFVRQPSVELRRDSASAASSSSSTTNRTPSPSCGAAHSSTSDSGDAFVVVDAARVVRRAATEAPLSGVDFDVFGRRSQHRPSVIPEDESVQQQQSNQRRGSQDSSVSSATSELRKLSLQTTTDGGDNNDSASAAAATLASISSSRATTALSGNCATNNDNNNSNSNSNNFVVQRHASSACASPTAFSQQSYCQTNNNLELISFEEENYEKHYYGREHWNYFTNDELLGPVMLSLKQEVNNQRDHFHVLLRTVSYTLHGTIPASTICANRYDRDAIVCELSQIAKLKPPLILGQLPSTPDELLKLDHMFIKSELKVGVIYIRDGQADSEEAILSNKLESAAFGEFLEILGNRVKLKGFDRYKGGLDTVHNLTGLESIYTVWRNIEIMFHVSTMLPHEENDPQKLQKKRHIGNDIVCVAFIEGDDTLFWPGCIKSYFLHTFIAIQTTAKPLKVDEKRQYKVSCVCRNEVQNAFKPFIVEQDTFEKGDFFREWLLVKIVNGERASYSAPKFARMQDRTRSQILEDIITNLANHLVTGQIPRPYRRGSWRPLGHTRSSSPLEDSMKDYFEDYETLAKDFFGSFCGPSKSVLCDVVFKTKDKFGMQKLVYGVRAIMAIRSRTFLEMLYGLTATGAGGSVSPHGKQSLRKIEMKLLSGGGGGGGGDGTFDSHQSLANASVFGGCDGGADSKRASSSSQFAVSQKQFRKHSASAMSKSLAKRGSVSASVDASRKGGSMLGDTSKERRQSMLPIFASKKPTYLTVPSSSGPGNQANRVGVGSSSSGTGALIRTAFNRLVSGNWSGWGGNIKSGSSAGAHSSSHGGSKGDHQPALIKVDQYNPKSDTTNMAMCKDFARIDPDILAKTEFEIKEFDYETFQQTIEYIHNGQCTLSYDTIPGLICAAEHYDLPDLLHACFHHANQHMKLQAAPLLLNSLYVNSCFYVSAMQLLNAILTFIDPQGEEFFSKHEYFLQLNESVLTTVLSRKTLQVSEIRKFIAMRDWSVAHATARATKLRLDSKLLQQQQQPLQQKLLLLQPTSTSTQTNTSNQSSASILDISQLCELKELINLQLQQQQQPPPQTPQSVPSMSANNNNNVSSSSSSLTPRAASGSAQRQGAHIQQNKPALDNQQQQPISIYSNDDDEECFVKESAAKQQIASSNDSANTLTAAKHAANNHNNSDNNKQAKFLTLFSEQTLRFSKKDFEAALNDEQFNVDCEREFKTLMHRLNNEVNLKLSKISNEDIVRHVLPTNTFDNTKLFDIMTADSRINE